MKKFLFPSFFSFLTVQLVGCTHIKVVAFDKADNTVTVQGGKWANDDDYQREAEKYCGGPASVVRMSERTVGSYTTAQVNSYGNSASGTATTVGIKRWDRTFRCEKDETK